MARAEDDQEYWEDEGEQEHAEPVRFTSTTGNIEAVRYNRQSRALFVTFKNGTYRYDNVDEDTAYGFEGASSATLYVNDQVKGAFEYEQLD